MSRKWCIVEFDDGVQIVPQSWLEGTTCYWPVFKSTNSQALFLKAVKAHIEPEKDIWSPYTVRILGVYDSYELAVPKLKLAELQSDLNTDNEEKKSRSSRKRIILSSDDEEEVEVAGIKPFPKTPKKMFIHMPSSSSTPTPLKRTSINTPSTSSAASTLDESFFLEETISHENSAQQRGKDCCNCCCKEYKEQTVQQFKEIKNQLQKIFEVLRENKQILPNPQEKERSDAAEFEGRLPMKTEEDVDMWEKQLSSQDEQKKMISFLNRIGGHDIGTIVKNILRKVWTDSLAAMHNWEGKKNKKPFSTLKLATVIKKAALASPHCSSRVTEQEVVLCIKNWLRHASARCSNNAKKTQENQNENQ